MSVETTRTWRELLQILLTDGTECAPQSIGADWRGRTSLELLAHESKVSMATPVVACPSRKMGYRFMCAEAAWILSGDNRLSVIAPFAKNLDKLSDDNRTMGGAYGPPFIDQVPYCVRTLANDPASRQAVLTIWRPRPGIGADVPCTISLQWLIRKENKLYCIVGMRSSDAWLGWVYDIFTFSMMSAFFALALRKYNVQFNTLELGTLSLIAGSQHLYKIDIEAARTCLADETTAFDVEPIDLTEFTGPDDLIRHLWALARYEPTEKRWLRELRG